MFRCKPLAVAVFAMWTLLVWANRIYNIVEKDGGDGVDLARAIGFVVVGLLVSALFWRSFPDLRGRTAKPITDTIPIATAS